MLATRKAAWTNQFVHCFVLSSLQSMFFREYLRMLGVVLAAMIVYYLTITPWIEWGADQPRKLSQGFVDLDRSEQWWAKLYDQDVWQSQHPERLLTKRAEILYKHVENIGTGRYRLKPLTILVPQRNEHQQQPSSVIVIENPEGAEVQFDSDIQLVSGGVQNTSLSNVHLDGNVTLRSLKLDNGLPTEVTMEAATSQLKIDGNRIWSPQEIELKLGNSIFLGRDFEFIASSDLLGKNDNDAQNGGPFAGLDHMEIYYVHRVDIELPEGGLLREQANEKWALGDIPAAHLLVQCKSSFYFDFSKLTASLKDKVVVQHWLAGFHTDQIQADRVDLQFTYRDKNTQPIKPDTQSDDANQTAKVDLGEGELALDRIEAFGKNTDNANDEARWVQIDAPNFLATCKTRWINLFAGKKN